MEIAPRLTTPPALAELARAQGGCILPTQAHGHGVSSKGITSRVSKGIWKRFLGSIIIPDSTVTVCPAVQEAWGITLARRPALVLLSGTMALRLLGHSPPRHLGDVKVLRLPPGVRARPEGVHIIEADSTAGLIRRIHGGLACTQASRALIDLVMCVAPNAAERWLDWAFHKHIITASDLRAAVDLHDRARTPIWRSESGRATARSLTRLRKALRYAEGGTRSEAERVLRELLKHHGIEGFESDWPVSPVGGGPPAARLDFAHPGARIAIEVDGRAFHSSSEAFESDRQRQNWLVSSGWTVLRFTWSMLKSDRTSVVAQIQAALTRGRGRGTTPNAPLRVDRGVEAA